MRPETLRHGKSGEKSILFDSNGDGLISALDALWNELKIWQDANQDGISQAHELKSLNELGFQEIKLTPTGGAQTQANGNQITSSAGYTKTDGTSGTYGNLSLASNDFYREFTDKIALTETAQSLADMQGAGAVRDLREAMSLSDPLTQNVAALNTQTRAQMLANLDTLIADWANTSTLKTSLEEAKEHGYRLAYLPSDMSAFDDQEAYWATSAGGNNSGGGVAPCAEYLWRICGAHPPSLPRRVIGVFVLFINHITPINARYVLGAGNNVRFQS